MTTTTPGADAGLELPLLRAELQLHRAEPSRDGQTLWTIHDPIAQRFYEVDEALVEVLALWGCGRSSAVDALLRARGRTPPDQQAWQAMLGFLEAQGLTCAQPGRTFARVRRQQQAPMVWWQHLIHNYLFFKVPLVRPDRFLRRTLPWVQPLFSRTALVLFALAGLAGLHLVSRQWEAFFATFADLTSAGGAALLVVCLALVKALHELGHGYAAVRNGSRVSTMGVAFMVMFPVLYTDTTDAWRLKDRRDRVAIDAAGMAVELMVAVLATLLWCLLDDGLARHIAFTLATTAWVMSLAINLNPLLRFDGYYLLGDALNLPNLQERSFAMGRWALRRVLWGWQTDKPEPARFRRTTFLIAFAWATWAYRFLLFLGIALLVYQFFFKALGVLLFALEIAWFIALPILRELRNWYEQRCRFGPRARWTVTALVVGVAALFMPWSNTIRVPAMLSADEQLPSYAPRPARVAQVLVREGDTVRTGDVLMQLEAPELTSALVRSRERAAALHERLARMTSDGRDLAQRLVLQREQQFELERVAGLQRDIERLTVRALIDGRVMQIARELHAGRWVDDKTLLIWLARPDTLVARGYMRADEARWLASEADGSFRDESISGMSLPVQVLRVGSAASRSMAMPLLASSFGGPVAARDVRGTPMSEVALIEVKARVLSNPSLATELRGELLLASRPSSVVERSWRFVARVWQRERIV